MHFFSLKFPIKGCVHQRKATVPCAFSMRKGIKGGGKIDSTLKDIEISKYTDIYIGIGAKNWMNDNQEWNQYELVPTFIRNYGRQEEKRSLVIIIDAFMGDDKEQVWNVPTGADNEITYNLKTLDDIVLSYKNIDYFIVNSLYNDDTHTEVLKLVNTLKETQHMIIVNYVVYRSPKGNEQKEIDQVNAKLIEINNVLSGRNDFIRGENGLMTLPPKSGAYKWLGFNINNGLWVEYLCEVGEKYDQFLVSASIHSPAKKIVVLRFNNHLFKLYDAHESGSTRKIPSLMPNSISSLQSTLKEQKEDEYDQFMCSIC